MYVNFYYRGGGGGAPFSPEGGVGGRGGGGGHGPPLGTPMQCDRFPNTSIYPGVEYYVTSSAVKIELVWIPH